MLMNGTVEKFKCSIPYRKVVIFIMTHPPTGSPFIFVAKTDFKIFVQFLCLFELIYNFDH
jgi:hypothetical protein